MTVTHMTYIYFAPTCSSNLCLLPVSILMEYAYTIMALNHLSANNDANSRADKKHFDSNTHSPSRIHTSASTHTQTSSLRSYVVYCFSYDVVIFIVAHSFANDNATLRQVILSAFWKSMPTLSIHFISFPPSFSCVLFLIYVAFNLSN